MTAFCPFYAQISMSNYFYTDASGQKFGPINDQQLQILAANGTIMPNTPLETEAGHQGFAGQIPGLFVSSSPFAVAAPSIAKPISPAELIKKLNNYFKIYWMAGSVSLALTFVGIVFFIVFFGMMRIADLARGPDQSTFGFMGAIAGICAALSYLFGCLLCIAGVVFFAMLLFQLWKLIPPDIARTTPAMAVGLVFIPFFNFYWIFVAYKGLGEDMNKLLLRRGIPYRINESLGLTACILILCCCIPYLGILFSLPGLIVMIFFIKSVKNGAITMLEQEINVNSTETTA